MPPDVILTVYDGSRNVRQIPVQSNRMTIGRHVDNDLVIDDAGLSRRHAIIEIFDGIVQVADCGSQNGTYVNRQRVTRATRLKDGDAILIGDACDIRVQIHNLNPSAPLAPVQSNQVALAPAPLAETATGSLSVRQVAQANWLQTHALALLAIGLILLLSGGLIYFVRNRQPVIRTQNVPSPVIHPETPIPVPTPSEPQAIPNTPNENESARNQINDLTKQVMRRVSSDAQPYILPPTATDEIKRRLEPYRNSMALVSALRALRQLGNGAESKSSNERVVFNLVAYAALAKSDGGKYGDVVAVFREVLSDIQYLRATFDTKTAEGSLILIAAYKTGRGNDKFHPLNNVLAKIPLTERNIWYMHEHSKLTDETYDFVVRFLALGIIAQNPRQFQINADPLGF